MLPPGIWLTPPRHELHLTISHPSRPISPHLAPSRPISPHLASSRLISPHLASSRLTSPHLASPRPISPHLASSRLISRLQLWAQLLLAPCWSSAVSPLHPTLSTLTLRSHRSRSHSLGSLSTTISQVQIRTSPHISHDLTGPDPHARDAQRGGARRGGALAVQGDAPRRLV